MLFCRFRKVFNIFHSCKYLLCQSSGCAILNSEKGNLNIKIETLKEALQNDEAKSELKKVLKEDLIAEGLDDEILGKITGGGGRWYLSDDADAAFLVGYSKI